LAETYLTEESFIVERLVNGGEYKSMIEVGKNSFFTDNTVNATNKYIYHINVNTSE